MITRTLDWAALFVLVFVPCVSMAYYVYTATVDSTLLLHSDCRQHTFIVSLLTDAAIVTQKLHACGESVICLLCCWQLRTHPKEWRQELQVHTTVQLTYCSYRQSLTCQGMGLSVISLLC